MFLGGRNKNAGGNLCLNSLELLSTWIRPGWKRQVMVWARLCCNLLFWFGVPGEKTVLWYC